MNDNNVIVVDSACPKCGYKFDRASHSSMTEKRRPEKGDLSVCIECAAILCYLNSAGDLRLATQEEIDGCDAESAYELWKVVEAVKAMNAKRKQAAKKGDAP